MAKSNAKGLKVPQGLKAEKPAESAEKRVEVEIQTPQGNQTVELGDNIVAEATDEVPEGEPAEKEDGSVVVYDEEGEAVGTMSAEDVEKVEEAAAENTPNIEVDTTTPKEQAMKAPNIEVKSPMSDPDAFKVPKQNVKIRLRVDHSCTIGKESYDFKAGRVYTVPKNVKKVLNRAGLLSPL